MKRNQKTVNLQTKKSSADTTQNRNYKDNLFVSLFGRCIDAKENFLSLYNAIHGLKLKLGETEIEPLMLENVVYNGQYNDVSMIINGKVVVLAEHQSTVNNNMPLRCLEYVTRSFERLFPEKDKYREKQIKLPCPEFYVFYNGTKEFPVESKIKLSDAFMFENSIGCEINLDLTVKVFNINYGKNHEILQKCLPLLNYSKFVHYATIAKESGVRDYIAHAIDRCKNEGIMVKYLESLNREDRNMIFGDWDWDTCIEVRTQEAKEEGIEIGKTEDAVSLLKMNLLSNEQISQATGLSLDKIKELALENQIR
ncbi:MAG: Rpn family recombination-promoting nuclease/putative transposase [Treponema sp.]|nr:Rpn family recombination-promoting nuclease/putative transposase [Candidatus Treponema equifaecale]